MTPLSLISDFQLPFKDGWLIPLEGKGRPKYLTKLDDGEKGSQESEDPGEHPEWEERLRKFDPEGYERLQKS